MSGCTGCGSCASGCGGCQSHVLLLTEAEIRLLRRFGELAFLPAACTRTNETPVYLSDLGGRAEISAAILALQVKRLISVDFALPLQGFDYAEYEDYPVRGSMALTAAGQEALDSLCDVTRSVSKMTEIEGRGGKRWDKPKKAEKSRDCGGGKF